MLIPQWTTTRVQSWQRLHPVVPVLLFGLAAVALVFRQEVAAAVATWRDSTAYNHCFLVLPVAAWLAYDRRHLWGAIPVRPLPWTAALAVPLVVVWLASERLGIMEGRQFVALAYAELLIVGVLGWPLARAFAAPLVYLVFLVPFGAFLTTPLQDFTVNFITHGLDLLGVPNFSNGYTIEIPEGVFFVAQACAGLRFLIAAVAFGGVYSVVLYRSAGRRLAFMAACMTVPVVANGVRALGIVLAGHLIGSAEAAAADHLIYGWLFFCVVLGLLILAGLPFRQDGQSPAAARPTAPGAVPTLRMAVPAILVAFLAGAGPLLASTLDRTAASVAAAAPATPPGCAPAMTAPAGVPGVDAASRAMLADAGAVAERFSCQGGRLQLDAVAFPPRTNPMLILSVQRSLTGQAEAEDIQIDPLQHVGASGWQRVKTTNPSRVSATALWIDGVPASGGLRSRLQQARNSVAGADRAVILAIVDSPDPASLAARLLAANMAGLSAQFAGPPGP